MHASAQATCARTYTAATWTELGGHDVAGGKDALTHVEPCVGSLQPEAGQAQAGAHHRHQKLSITCGCGGVGGGGGVNLSIVVEPLYVVVEAARGIALHPRLGVDGIAGSPAC